MQKKKKQVIFMCQCIKTRPNKTQMKIYEYRTAIYNRLCCYKNFSRSMRLHNSSGGALSCMQSEIILSFVPHRAHLHPQIVKNNNKIILQFLL